MQEALNQGESGEDSGFDVALVIGEQGSAGRIKLHYSGAKIPLYYKVPGSETIEIIKPDRQSIGGLTRSDRHFQTHTVELPENTMIYLSTDGIIDQNGGSDGKKFGSRRFVDLLNSISDLSVQDQQHRIENTIEDFMHDFEDKKNQRDDILIFGVRL